MKTTKSVQFLVMLCSVFLFTSLHAQKNKDKLTKASKDKGKKEVQVANSEEKMNSPQTNFINRNDIIFHDDFNNEKEGEFPSKWTQMTGTMQNSQLVALGKEEGVVQFISAGRLKPTFKDDNYLGDAFKIEGQFYFRGIGNEAYTLNLKDKNDVYATYIITIRGDGIVPAGTSSQYARMPYKLPYPGWRTVQLSFNNGTLKVSYEGTQLINIPDLIKYKDKHLKEFTHLEVNALPSGSNAMINHISIARGGLPLYDRLMNTGRIVIHDIHFDVDSFVIKQSSYPALDKIVTMLQKNSKIEVGIEGHTDANGSNEDNLILSEKRAEAVKNYLNSKGIVRYRLSTKGYGEERPISEGNNEKAWALNRRVEFSLRR